MLMFMMACLTFGLNKILGLKRWASSPHSKKFYIISVFVMVTASFTLVLFLGYIYCKWLLVYFLVFIFLFLFYFIFKLVVFSPGLLFLPIPFGFVVEMLALKFKTFSLSAVSTCSFSNFGSDGCALLDIFMFLLLMLIILMTIVLSYLEVGVFVGENVHKSEGSWFNKIIFSNGVVKPCFSFRGFSTSAVFHSGRSSYESYYGVRHGSLSGDVVIPVLKAGVVTWTTFSPDELVFHEVFAPSQGVVFNTRASLNKSTTGERSFLELNRSASLLGFNRVRDFQKFVNMYSDSGPQQHNVNHGAHMPPTILGSLKFNPEMLFGTNIVYVNGALWWRGVMSVGHLLTLFSGLYNLKKIYMCCAVRISASEVVVFFWNMTEHRYITHALLVGEFSNFICMIDRILSGVYHVDAGISSTSVMCSEVNSFFIYASWEVPKNVDYYDHYKWNDDNL